MKVNDLVNLTVLCKVFGRGRYVIKRNHVPKIYRKAVDELNSFLEYWINKYKT